MNNLESPSAKVHNGSVEQPTNSQDRIPLEKQLELVARYQQGDEQAGETLLQLYNPYLMRKAKALLEEVGKENDNDLLEDILQEGRLGVVISAEKHRDQGSLTTRVYNMSSRLMLRHLQQLTSPLQVPESMYDDSSNFDPSAQDASPIAERFYQIGDKEHPRYSLPSTTARRDIHFLQRVLSSQSLEEIAELEADTADLQDIEVDGFSIASENTPQNTLILESQVQAALARLSERDRIVIELTFGVGADDTRTYSVDEVGKMMSISPTRVRQIQMRALSKLRSTRFVNLKEGL